jgi:hypothetical protein
VLFGCCAGTNRPARCSRYARRVTVIRWPRHSRRSTNITLASALRSVHGSHVATKMARASPGHGDVALHARARVVSSTTSCLRVWSTYAGRFLRWLSRDKFVVGGGSIVQVRDCRMSRSEDTSKVAERGSSDSVALLLNSDANGACTSRGVHSRQRRARPGRRKRRFAWPVARHAACRRPRQPAT